MMSVLKVLALIVAGSFALGLVLFLAFIYMMGDIWGNHG